MGEDCLNDLRIKLFARPNDFDDMEGTLDKMLEIVTRARKEWPERDAMIFHGRCPHCKCDITAAEFDGKDRWYHDEFNISGLCAKCQDEVFGNDGGEC